MKDRGRQFGESAGFRLLHWLMPTVEKFPRSHKFTIGDRIEIIAIDVLEALIEATYTRERSQHLRQANLGIEKLRFLLRLAADLNLRTRLPGHSRPRHPRRRCLCARTGWNSNGPCGSSGAQAHRGQGSRCLYQS